MITYEAQPGETIQHAALAACGVAEKCGKPVRLVFNTLMMSINPKSYFTDIELIYSLKLELRRAELGARKA